VQEQESGAGQKGQGHEEQPRVVMAAGGGAHPRAEHHIDQRDREDEPEVAGLVLPEEVGLGSRQQQPEAGHR
jgi:hypothetical protein